MSVLSWGSNRHGQLGRACDDAVRGGAVDGGRDSNKVGPLPCEVLDLASHGVEACRVAAGAMHSLALTEYGEVWSWGRNKEGQCGTGVLSDTSTPQRVGGLDRDTIVDVACGFSVSYAVAANGTVYTWGAVHEEADEKSTGVTGEMVGHLGVVNHVRDRIVAASEERYLLAGEDMDGTGRTQNTGESEEQGGLRVMQTQRTAQPKPIIVSSLKGVWVVRVCAGYGHALAVSSDGKLYAQGYNDRGALGLGHRLNKASFTEIKSLSSDWFVTTMCCGGSHNLAIAIPRHSNLSSQASPFLLTHRTHDYASNGDGNRMGGTVFVWGSGSLGQLGLGAAASYRARLRPVPLLKGATDVAAGDNHSVAVLTDGSVWVWGSGNYNELGTGVVSGRDLHDRLYYYSPRRLEGMPHGTRVVRVECGNNFTMALTDTGGVYSWGWHGQGALGRHVDLFGPSEVEGLGVQTVTAGRGSVLWMSGGQSHCLVALADNDPESHTTANNVCDDCRGAAVHRRHRPLLLPLLEDPDSADMMLELPVDGTQGPATSEPHTRAERRQERVMPKPSACVWRAHAFILAARSLYLAGLLRAARSASSSSESPLRVVLVVPGLSEDTMPVLLRYIYTDRLSGCPRSLLRDVCDIGTHMCMPRLTHLAHLEEKKARRWKAWGGRGSLSHKCTNKSCAASDVQSKWISHMTRLVTHKLDTHPHAAAVGGGHADAVMRGHSSAGMTDTDIAFSVEGSEGTTGVFGAHSIVVRRASPYFRAMLDGGFREGALVKQGKAAISMTELFTSITEECDGVSVLRAVLEYVYTGSTSVLPLHDPTQVMTLAAVADRLSVHPLREVCERHLLDRLSDHPDNATNLLDFALRFDLRFLASQCNMAVNGTYDVPLRWHHGYTFDNYPLYAFKFMHDDSHDEGAADRVGNSSSSRNSKSKCSSGGSGGGKGTSLPHADSRLESSSSDIDSSNGNSHNADNRHHHDDHDMQALEDKRDWMLYKLRMPPAAVREWCTRHGVPLTRRVAYGDVEVARMWVCRLSSQRKVEVEGRRDSLLRAGRDAREVQEMCRTEGLMPPEGMQEWVCPLTEDEKARVERTEDLLVRIGTPPTEIERFSRAHGLTPPLSAAMQEACVAQRAKMLRLGLCQGAIDHYFATTGLPHLPRGLDAEADACRDLREAREREILRCMQERISLP